MAGMAAGLPLGTSGLLLGHSLISCFSERGLCSLNSVCIQKRLFFGAILSLEFEHVKIEITH